MYLVDAADATRIEESKRELDRLLSDTEMPTLILGNKIDVDGALSEPRLHQTTGKGVIPLPDYTRPLEVFMCSIANREGYGTGFKWLSQYM